MVNVEKLIQRYEKYLLVHRLVVNAEQDVLVAAEQLEDVQQVTDLVHGGRYVVLGYLVL